MHEEFTGQIAAEPIRRRLRAQMRTSAQSVASFELPDFDKQPTLDQAQDQIAQILAQARREAELMVEQGRQMRDAELEAARREGYEAGLREGVEAVDRELAGTIATAEAIATNVAREREQTLARNEGDVVELAIAIAARIVNAAIDVDPDRVVDICRGAMRKAFQRESLTVLAHPDDLQTLREAGPEMAAQLGGVHHLDFVEERRLERGSVIVRTPAGEIDATIDAKRERIEIELREAIEERRNTAFALPAAEPTDTETDSDVTDIDDDEELIHEDAA